MTRESKRSLGVGVLEPGTQRKEGSKERKEEVLGPRASVEKLGSARRWKKNEK